MMPTFVHKTRATIGILVDTYIYVVVGMPTYLYLDSYVLLLAPVTMLALNAVGSSLPGHLGRYSYGS